MGNNGSVARAETAKPAMEIRALRPEEWSLGPEPHAWPPDTIVLGAFSGDALIGRTAIVSLPHIEGTWSSKENPWTAFRLIKSLEALLKYLGRTHVFSFVLDSQPEIPGYLTRLGYEKQPLSVWVKRLGD